jgi:hypothetical protein
VDQPPYASLKLPTLKDLLDQMIKSKEFACTYDYFCIFFADNPIWACRGTPHEDKFLDYAVPQCLQKVKLPPLPSHALQYRHLSDDDFIYGYGLFGGYVLTVLYFTKPMVGLIAIVSINRDGQSHYARFGNRPGHEGLTPSAN